MLFNCNKIFFKNILLYRQAVNHKEQGLSADKPLIYLIQKTG